MGDIIQPDGFSYWILKIDGANKKSLGESDGMGKIEYVYYRMAKEAGIDISESTLYEENNRFHFLTKRFDRTDKGEKIHMQSFGALAGIDYKIQMFTNHPLMVNSINSQETIYWDWAGPLASKKLIIFRSIYFLLFCRKQYPPC